MSIGPSVMAIKLEDFGQLRERYEGLKLTARACAALKGAELALDTAERILAEAAQQPKIRQAFDKLRKNSLLTGKMRASEARTLLMDESDDFIEGTRRKLAAWRKAMERIAAGEGVENAGGRDQIPKDHPLALAIIGSAGVANFLSIAQLALAELGRIEGQYAAKYPSACAEIRRCATILSDCETASGILAAIR